MVESRPGPPGQAGFRLAGFPKEFERNFWEEFDKRYYAILFITWVISFSFAFIMANREWELSQEELARLKHKVIQRVYGTEILIPEPKVEELETTLGETAPAEEKKPEKELGEKGKKLVEESALDRQKRLRQARGNVGKRVREMEQEVSNVGLLGIVTAAGGQGAGSVDYANVLGQGGGTSDLGKIVKGTTGIAVASAPGERTRVARGGGYRGAGEGEGIDALIEGGTVGGGATSLKRRGEIEIAEDIKVTGTGASAGGRDAQSLLTIINKNKTAIEYCYQRFLKLNPSLSGRIDLELEIDPNGRVIQVRVLRSTVSDKKLEQCVVRAVKRWRNFGKIDPSLGNVRTRLPIIF